MSARFSSVSSTLPSLSLGSLLIGAALWARPAMAQTASPEPPIAEPANTHAVRAVQLNEAGSELYAAGNYIGALQAFQRAYQLIVEPNLLFNIAGCHERLGQRAEAIEYYRRFLSAPEADVEGRRRAIEALRELEAAPVVVEAPAEPKASSGWDHPAWPLATLGTGILFAGLGAGLYLDGAHDHNEVESAPNYAGTSHPGSMTEVEARTLVESGNTKKLVGGVGFGLGGALVATHVALSLWRGARLEAPQVRAELRLTPRGCVITGSF